MKHNKYADGKLQNIEFSDKNSNKSVWVIEVGKYNFTTEYEETIQCLTWLITINNINYTPGQKVTIAKNKEFTIVAKETSSYLCLYK